MTTEVIGMRDQTKSPDETYIGRAGKGKPGPFGNPIVKGRQCQICGTTHLDGGSTLACYEIYLRNRLASDEVFAKAFWELKGKRLLCFCRPKDGFKPNQLICHGQIMAKILDGDVLD